MKRRSTSHGCSHEAGRALPGFPNGWFAAGFSHELLPGGILSRQCMGQALVLVRTRSGRAWAMDAYCPHMGAHFGHGGTVEGEVIRCPFHGFCFDQRGTCVATGYGTRPPPTARVGTWPLREVDGLLLIYYDGLGKEPGWEIPGYDWEGWTAPRTKLWRLHTHPQETTENSVDIGHFRSLHGYQALEPFQDLLTEGPHLSTRYAMRRPSGFFGKSGQGVRAKFEIHVYGLGYSFVEVSIPVSGLRTRHLVCATPIEQGMIELRISVSVHKLSQPQQITPLLWLVPHELLNRLVSRKVFHVFVHDLQQDFEVWEQKRSLHPPALAAGDGPVGTYRTWARQFYPRPATETVSHASLLETA